MNSFGVNFRLSIFGESHGEVIGITLDGVDAGIPLSYEDFTYDIDRRRGGAQLGTTPRAEADSPQIVSGLYRGETTGAPLTILFYNGDTRSKDYDSLRLHPRPSHADFVAMKKYSGANDPRGGGHFSGRMTLALVAAGVVAKKMLPDTLKINSTLKEVGGRGDNFEEVIRGAMERADSVGGVVECRVSGLEVGIGEPLFNSVESVLAHLLFSVPAVKGVEFGDGFRAAAMYGSEHNDLIVDVDGSTSTNHSGGVVGGITNGNELVVRVAIKPTPSIAQSQKSIKFADETLSYGVVEELKIEGRHDSCIALRTPVVIESVVAIGLLDLIKTK